jgi:hypothetical protein
VVEPAAQWHHLLALSIKTHYRVSGFDQHLLKSEALDGMPPALNLALSVPVPPVEQRLILAKRTVDVRVRRVVELAVLRHLPHCDHGLCTHALIQFCFVQFIDVHSPNEAVQELLWCDAAQVVVESSQKLQRRDARIVHISTKKRVLFFGR